MTTHTPDVRIKRIYEPAAKDDGARVLVDRLWPRGVRKERAALTLWLEQVAPSAQLRAWFNHDPARWVQFGRRYRAELAANGHAVAQLGELLTPGPLTLLYAAHDTEHNHARVLADYLRRQARGRTRVRPRRVVECASPTCSAPRGGATP